MQITNYESKHYDQICDWLEARDMAVLPKNAFPLENGFLVEGIACLFLIKTNTNYCMFEYLISNPNIEKTQRDIAIKYLTINAMIEAKKLNYDYVLNHTELNKVCNYLKDLGFTQISDKTSVFIGSF